MSATHTPIKKILLVEDEAPLANVMGIELKMPVILSLMLIMVKMLIAGRSKNSF